MLSKVFRGKRLELINFVSLKFRSKYEEDPLAHNFFILFVFFVAFNPLSASVAFI